MDLHRCERLNMVGHGRSTYSDEPQKCAAPMIRILAGREARQNSEARMRGRGLRWRVTMHPAWTHHAPTPDKPQRRRKAVLKAQMQLNRLLLFQRVLEQVIALI
jgi:hypothetical protein